MTRAWRPRCNGRWRARRSLVPRRRRASPRFRGAGFASSKLVSRLHPEHALGKARVGLRDRRADRPADQGERRGRRARASRRPRPGSRTRNPWRPGSPRRSAPDARSRDGSGRRRVEAEHRAAGEQRLRAAGAVDVRRARCRARSRTRPSAPARGACAPRGTGSGAAPGNRGRPSRKCRGSASALVAADAHEVDVGLAVDLPAAEKEGVDPALAGAVEKLAPAIGEGVVRARCRAARPAAGRPSARARAAPPRPGSARRRRPPRGGSPRAGRRYVDQQLAPARRSPIGEPTIARDMPRNPRAVRAGSA